MNRRFNSLVKLLIKFEVDVEVHHLEVVIYQLVDERKILLNNLCLDSTVFKKTVYEIMVGNILFPFSKFIVCLIKCTS